MIYVIFMAMLMIENEKCVDFEKTCQKDAIIELRKECPNIQHRIKEMRTGALSIWDLSGVECLENAPKNKLVIKYRKLLKIEENE